MCPLNPRFRFSFEAFFDKMLSQLSDTLEKWLDKGISPAFGRDLAVGQNQQDPILE